MSAARTSRVIVLAMALTGCGESSRSARPNVDRATATEPDGAHACGAFSCEADEFCVESQGALCSPLPPPGEACPEGCTLTEHCCNCPAFACLRAPSEHCPSGPTCACLEAEFLESCGADRRECTESPVGTEVLCILVAYDEDPFASDAGSSDAGSNVAP